MKVLGIIPSRFGSTRFPGKPLADIGGKSMIHRVYHQASVSPALNKVVVATDDQRIFDHVRAFGGEVIMTGSHHPSGTDRCMEALEKIGGEWDAVINIQGDEPFVPSAQLSELAHCFLDASTQIATVVKPVEDPADLSNPNRVKVVLNKNQEALYFSRQPIPHLKGMEKAYWLSKHNYYKHCGLYGYKPEILKELTQLQPSSLEIAESLEQLRWLENGYNIKVAITAFESWTVDTPEDISNLPFHLINQSEDASN